MHEHMCALSPKGTWTSFTLIQIEKIARRFWYVRNKLRLFNSLNYAIINVIKLFLVLIQTASCHRSSLLSWIHELLKSASDFYSWLADPISGTASMKSVAFVNRARFITSELGWESSKALDFGISKRFFNYCEQRVSCLRGFNHVSRQEIINFWSLLTAKNFPEKKKTNKISAQIKFLSRALIFIPIHSPSWSRLRERSATERHRMYVWLIENEKLKIWEN